VNQDQKPFLKREFGVWWVYASVQAWQAEHTPLADAETHSEAYAIAEGLVSQ
jgi:hypothetical protein